MTESSERKHAASSGHDQQHHEKRIFWGWWLFAAIALFYLLAEHRAHFLGALPYLLLLACPVMHMFMHHGSHHRHGTRETSDSKENGE